MKTTALNRNRIHQLAGVGALNLALLAGVAAPAQAGALWDDNDYVIANGSILVVLHEDFTTKALLAFPYIGMGAGTLDWMPNGDLAIFNRGVGGIWFHTCDSDGNLNPPDFPADRYSFLIHFYEVKVDPSGTGFYASGYREGETPVTEWNGNGPRQTVGSDWNCDANAVISKADGTHELWVNTGCDFDGVVVYPLAADSSIMVAGKASTGIRSTFNTMTFDPVGRRVLFPQSTDCGGNLRHNAIFAVDAETRTPTRIYSIPADQFPSPGTWFAGVTAGESGKIVAFEGGPTPELPNASPPFRQGLSVWNADGTGYRFVNLKAQQGFDGLGGGAYPNKFAANIVWTGNSPAFRNRAPTITGPAATTLDCVPAAGSPFDVIAVVTDPDSNQTLTVSLTDGATVLQQSLATPASNTAVTFSSVVFAPGTHSVTLSVSDGQKSASTQVTIQVNPYAAPTVVTSPSDAVVECPNPADFGVPSFHSVCDASLTVTSQDLALPLVGKEISKTRRTWTATDDLGQSIATSQILTVMDTTAPSIDSVPSDISVDATSASGATVNYPAATATDTCGAVGITYSQNSGTLFPVGTTTVVCTATDAVGNQVTTSFTVTVAPLPPTPDASAQLDALIATVKAMSINKTVKAALLISLGVAKVALESNRISLAIGAMKTFEAAVEAARKAKHLTADQATQLTAASVNIRTALAGP